MANPKLLSQTGSTLVETAIAIPLLILLVIGLLSAAFIAFSKIWIRQSSYEAVICLAAREIPAVCRERLQEQLSGVLPGLVRRARLTRNSREARVRFEMDLLGHIRFQEERVMKLPLQIRRGS
ncbi:MAG: pilus assembly protein [Bdellovibrionaceae bacterium]|nr:pilus assembly protein [Pseudobdellovibrionaceae bacterium]